jgi:DNA-directed RNA polymerase subunit RPC12/RpoP
MPQSNRTVAVGYFSPAPDHRDVSRKDGGRTPPDVCPDCGARDSFRERHVTGGGWRREYRCGECGYRWMPKG